MQAVMADLFLLIAGLGLILIAALEGRLWEAIVGGGLAAAGSLCLASDLARRRRDLDNKERVS